ncbi:MAG: uracil-DNA glycosylase family protein [Thiohalomonadaceae bacterium]
MAMDERRRRYLEAMGVQAWRRRGGAMPPEDAAVAPAEHPPVVVEQGHDALIPVGEPRPPVLTPAAELDDAEVAAMDWEALAARVARCTRCPELVANRTQTVFGVGNRAAEVMVIGEAPGQEEDKQGEPFVGRAGQLLNEMLRAMGFAREQVYIANVLKSRPPNNRDPRPEEAAHCEPYLKRQIALIKPRLILSVGRISAQNLLKTDTPIGKLRGQVHRYQGIPLVVTYHPAYLLRSPLEKRKSWDDLKLALRTLREARAP